MSDTRQPDVSLPILSRDEALGRSDFTLSTLLLNAWERMAADGCAKRQHLDPLMFGPQLLPNIVIVDVLDDGTDFQWRLFGGAHVTEYGVNLTGMRLSALMGQDNGADQILKIFQTCQQTAAPTFYDVRYLSHENVPRACTGVLVPLFADNGAVAHLLGCAQWRDAGESRTPQSER